MRTVSESELAERRALREEMGINSDPYLSIRERIAEVDEKLSDLERQVNRL